MFSRGIQVDFGSNYFSCGFFHYSFWAEQLHANGWELIACGSTWPRMCNCLSSVFAGHEFQQFLLEETVSFPFSPQPVTLCALFVTHAKAFNPFYVGLSHLVSLLVIPAPFTLLLLFSITFIPSLYFLPAHTEMCSSRLLFAVAVCSFSILFSTWSSWTFL